MLKTRVIPCLLLQGPGLVKTVKFDSPKYVGDPINAVRIFNEKEVDELTFLDISATREDRGPNFELIRNIASEVFMPLAYGGGITSVAEVERLCTIGVEKVVINSSACSRPALIQEATTIVGSQSVVVSIDVKRSLFGRRSVFSHGGTTNTKRDPVDFAKIAEDCGGGEILLTSVDRDGGQMGYDLDLVRDVSSAVSIPVIACGGAGSLSDLVEAVANGASAVAAGSLFVFLGKHRAVLITYPEYVELERAFAQVS